LEKIKTARQDLETTARNVLSVDDDLPDLQEREKVLYSEGLKLSKYSGQNFRLAEKLAKRASGLLSVISDSIQMDFFKLDRIASDAKKLANQILAE